jgi:hypothetical protein
VNAIHSPAANRKTRRHQASQLSEDFLQDRVAEQAETQWKIGERRIRNVPEANRERAFFNSVKTEGVNQMVRPVGHGVRS